MCFTDALSVAAESWYQVCRRIRGPSCTSRMRSFTRRSPSLQRSPLPCLESLGFCQGGFIDHRARATCIHSSSPFTTSTPLPRVPRLCQGVPKGVPGLVVVVRKSIVKCNEQLTLHVVRACRRSLLRLLACWRWPKAGVLSRGTVHLE